MAAMQSFTRITLPSKLWQRTQLKKALFITKDLQCRLQAEETLPDYLLVDSILCYEIGLRLGSNINSLMTAAKTIIRKLHRIDISSIDALIDYLSEGYQRLVSASEIDPFQGPYATLKDGEMIIYLPKERKDVYSKLFFASCCNNFIRQYIIK
ncbi:hypothetical protein Anas_14239 [Armadillidium nasatum]|uniref:Uncharacterized protein n=1 Tax=Armadillidium nasatum TaxID=96803 RepID=A0A5N5T519_9CRUS|nr:hypothetical protein Anas_14239 [Armadillidium nasatum]